MGLKMYVIRHGQSETNLRHAHGGFAQVPLTEKGFADAAKAGKRLEGIAFDRVYASDLRRAVQTAQTALPNRERLLDARLREIDVGSLEERPVADCEAMFGDAYRENKKNRDYSAYGGETQEMQFSRVADFMHDLEKTAETTENVAVFAHGGTLLGMADYVLHLPDKGASLRIENGSVTVFEYENGKWFMRLT